MIRTALGLSFILLIALGGCNDTVKQSENSSAKNATEATKLEAQESSAENEQWIQHFNAKSKDIQELYTPQAVKVFSDGSIATGQKQIMAYYLKNNASAASIHTDTLLLADADKAIEYEISETVFSTTEKNKNLIIWQTTDSERKRVFEFESKISESQVDLAAIEQRRTQWMRLCNQHNAKQLISEMYTDNTIYFNHKPVIQGQSDLEAVYQYMNNSSYELSLSPIIIRPANEHFVFEIGQCDGSYGGNYILIWKKEADGKWKIFIDSNI